MSGHVCACLCLCMGRKAPGVRSRGGEGPNQVPQDQIQGRGLQWVGVRVRVCELVCAQAVPTLSQQHPKGFDQPCAQLKFYSFKKGSDTGPCHGWRRFLFFYVDFFVLIVYYKETGAVAGHEQLPLCARMQELSHLCAHNWALHLMHMDCGTSLCTQAAL